MQDEDAAAERTPAVQARSGPGWLVGALAVVGGIALLGAGALAALSALLQWHDPALPQALDRLSASARSLPSVRSVTTEEGLGDLGVDPVDGYADVRLGTGCTADDVTRVAADLRRLVRREGHVLLHPTVRCAGRGFTVSSDAAVTAARLGVYRDLAADRGLREAVLDAPQVGDDPTPDRDDRALTLRIATSGGVGATAERWRDRLAGRLPPLRIVVTNGDPGEPQGRSGVGPGIRTVEAGSDSRALLAIARRLDGLAGAGWYVGAEPCTVAVRAPWSGPLADRVIAEQPAGCTLEWQTTARPTAG